MARKPKNRTIRIHVDSQHEFHYEDLFDGTDQARIKLIKDDRLAWVLDSSIAERTFQIDFGVINPFQNGVPFSLRGINFIVSPKVEFPLNFVGSRILKYSVSLGNGWFDDPDVVPVPADGVGADTRHPDECFISWKASPPDEIQLTPVDPSAPTTDPDGVTWRWHPSDPKNNRPFTLEFLSPPPGWPTLPVHSTTDKHPTIILYLPPGPKTEFTITTTKNDGNDTAAKGTLLITA